MIEVYFDGACHLWKKSSYAFIIKEGDSWITSGYGSVPVPPNEATSNVAEHYALMMALEWLMKNGYVDKKIVVRGDSKLVIKQIFKDWQIRDSSLPYARWCPINKDFIKNFTNIRGKLIPREHNEKADELSKLGLYS